MGDPQKFFWLCRKVLRLFGEANVTKPKQMQATFGCAPRRALARPAQPSRPSACPPTFTLSSCGRKKRLVPSATPQDCDKGTGTTATLPSLPAPPPPPASSSAVASASATAAGIMLATALVVRAAALPIATAFGHDTAAVAALTDWARLPPSPASAAGVALGTAAAVTAARVAVCAAVPAFAADSSRSNGVVLPNLSPAETALWTAAVPALAEELLFRGALLPAAAPDVRGAAIAAAVFGSLHVGGGRGPVFAAWATGVGLLYGGLTLATGSVWPAVGAHALANGAAAALWWAGRQQQQEEKGDSAPPE